MSKRLRSYTTRVEWTGNRGQGTRTAGAYGRDSRITAHGKPVIHASSDASLRGDPGRWSPEELLLASLSTCHKLAYLGLCAAEGIQVQEYVDHSSGTTEEDTIGAAQFTEVTLHPAVIIATAAHERRALELHEDARRMCAIARSMNFPIYLEAVILTEDPRKRT